MDNEFTNGTPHEHLESTTDFTVPYDYTAQSPADAKADVEEFAGSGVVDTSS